MEVLRAAFDLWTDYLGLNKVLGNIIGSGLREPGLANQQGHEKLDAEQQIALSSLNSYKARHKLKNICAFYKQNEESEHIHNSHALKHNEGKIMCPVLREYTCQLCNVSGDRAHTKHFCHLRQGKYKSMYTNVSRKTASKHAIAWYLQ
uniref:Nanos-type domain-containing protein n=1 Tax=Callorhinchus milii TaxID=7868 RepID=A0A4W3GAX0_CALMI